LNSATRCRAESHFPSACIFFNQKIFVSYGIADIIGPQIAGCFKDAAKGSVDPSVWITPFIIAGLLCLLGAAVTLFSRPPKKA